MIVSGLGRQFVRMIDVVAYKEYRLKEDKFSAVFVIKFML